MDQPTLDPKATGHFQQSLFASQQGQISIPFPNFKFTF